MNTTDALPANCKYCDVTLHTLYTIHDTAMVRTEKAIELKLLAVLLGWLCCIPGGGAQHFVDQWESLRFHSPDSVAAVHALAARILRRNDTSDLFSFSALRPAKGNAFEISADGAKPKIAGTTGVALATGLYHYLKYSCNASEICSLTLL